MGKQFQDVYDFDRLIKVKENRDGLERFDAKVDRHKQRLRELLDIDENVLVLAERLRKKTLLEDYTKVQLKTKLILNRDKILTISARSKLNNKQHLFALAQQKRTKNKR